MAFTCGLSFFTVGAVKKSRAAPRYEHPMFNCSWKEMCNVGINHRNQFCTGHKK